MKKEFGTVASRKVIIALEAAGYEAVYVGGAVRDYLLSKPATDIDIATSAYPDEVKAVFSNTIDLGTEHGTVLVLMNHEPIEVTTFRVESNYSDHRRPDEVQFVRSLEEDLKRRDFTINALALTKEGKLIDLYDGEKDLENKIIRAVGQASDRFKEDALRMIRAIRFSSVLDFRIIEETLSAISTNATQMKFISVERIKVEMDKLFDGVNPAKAFFYLFESGLNRELPLFPASREKLEATIPYICSMTGWASLMITGNFSPTQLSNAYKLSNREKSFLVHVNEAYTLRLTKSFTVDEIYHYDLDVLLTTERLINRLRGNNLSEVETAIERAKFSLPIQSRKELRVTGKELMQWTGLSGGRWTGEWIEKIETAVLYSACKNDPILIRDWFLREFKR